MRANFFASDLVNLLPLALFPIWVALLRAPHGWVIATGHPEHRHLDDGPRQAVRR